MDHTTMHGQGDGEEGGDGDAKEEGNEVEDTDQKPEGAEAEEASPGGDPENTDAPEDKKDDEETGAADTEGGDDKADAAADQLRVMAKLIPKMRLQKKSQRRKRRSKTTVPSHTDKEVSGKKGKNTDVKQKVKLKQERNYSFDSD
uniref:Uncharacterized protein n=1 Tax=Ditylenchus dipsaci TaxID=166011 RepID=A0A915EUG3_9BILA